MKPGGWRLVVCGISHKTSTLDEREPVQIGNDELARANALFGSLPMVMESVIITTCNRVEFFFITGRGEVPFDVVADFYRQFNDRDITALQGLFHTRKGTHAVDHLFRVTGGIDSMVLGENQILGQVKGAYSSACAVKSVGKVLHRLFHQAFRVGKQVRSETEMGKGACSVSSAAVGMLASRTDSLDRPAILFVGANQMIDLAAGKLAGLHHSRLMFANRTVEKAAALSEKYGGEGFGLDKLPGLMSRADVVITCTSSKEPVIRRNMVEQVVADRVSGGIIIVDLAIPRDVDYPKDGDPAVEICDLEDIKDFIKDQQENREKAIPQAEEIIEYRTAEYNYWFDHVKQEPIYNGKSNTIETIRSEELNSILGKLSPELQNELNKASRRLVERIIRITGRKADK